MKHVHKLLLGCGLLLTSVSPLTKVQEQRKEDLYFSTEVAKNKKEGVNIRKITSSEDNKIGKTYVLNGTNSENRVLRFITPVSGDFTSIKYFVTIDGYSENAIEKNVTNVYKGVTASDGKINYFDGENIVNKSDATSSWYWACYTIEFSTTKYYDSAISAYVVARERNDSLTSEAIENVKLSEQITNTKKEVSSDIIGKWKNEDLKVTIDSSSLVINDFKLDYYDGFNNHFIFKKDNSYLNVSLNDDLLSVKGVVDERRYDCSLSKNTLISCPITFTGNNKYESGSSENIEITVPTDVKYDAYYEKDGVRYSDYKYGLPQEEGYYSLVVEVEEDDTYDYTKKWFIFEITERINQNKITPTITFNFDAGTKFALGETPTYTIKDESGNEISDADVTVNYTSDTTGYNSSDLPMTAGDYGITVTVNADDKYNKVSLTTWFRVLNEIKTTISSNVSEEYIYQGNLENIIDGNDSTYCWFSNPFDTGDYIQLDFSCAKEINKVRFVLDNREEKSDYFKFKLQYLNESNQYIDLSEEMDTYFSIIQFDTIKTKSIRLITTSSTGKWNIVSEVSAYLAPNVTNNGFTYVNNSNNNIDNLSDSNLETYTFFDWNYTSSCNLILDYEKETTVNTITLLTGCSERKYDYAKNVKFSYSLDGINYTDIEGTYQGYNILVKLDTPIQARYIKMTPILDGESKNGLTIREFGINLNKFKVTLTFGDETEFTYDGEHHAPTYNLPFAVPHTVHYTNEEQGLYNQEQAIEKGWWAIVVSPTSDDEIYSFEEDHKVFTIVE